MSTFISQIFASIKCVNHKQKTEFINLSSSLNQNQSRLLCQKCDFNINCDNVFEKNEVVEFLENIQIQQKNLQEDYDKQYNLFRQLKDQINGYLNSIEEQFQQEKQSILEIQIIKPGNTFDLFLQNNNGMNIDLIKKMSDQLSQLIIQNQDTLQLKTESIIQKEEDLWKLKQKIEKLQQFEQLINKRDSQIYQQQQQLSQLMLSTTQSFINIQVNFIKTYEKKLDEQIIYDLKFNNNGNIFVIASNLIVDTNSYVQIYQKQNGEIILIQNIEIHEGDVRQICFNSQDDNFFTACQDKKIRFWKQKEQNKWSLEQELIELNSPANCIILNNSQNYLVAGGDCLYFWKLVNGKWTHDNQEKDCGQRIKTLSFNLNDQLLAVGYQDYSIRIFEYYNEKWIQKMQIQKQAMLINFYNENDLVGVQRNGYFNFYEYDNQISDYQISEIQLNEENENYIADFCIQKKIFALSQQGKGPINLFMANENRVSKPFQTIPFQGDQLFFSNNGNHLAIISNKQLFIYQDEGERY
ncbi:unnamed protein product [Paramecium sonneborni]|uniref:Anaphase-promoting complex subunit 4-like WD40 domain-containing protein n=1 Tax=Paramecium sonneborni TaxID=65129 RepID=A0A8S1MNY1_9CILI|nr:unnamed protein product [Paramecium sonneborni]